MKKLRLSKGGIDTKIKIRPTEGEFDIEEDRRLFAQKFFWTLLIKQPSFIELFKDLLNKYDNNLNYPQNEWNIQYDIETWIKEHQLSANQSFHWLYVWILHYIEMKSRHPGLREEMYQLLSLREAMPRYPPKIKGLQFWHYNDYTAAEYIENQRLQALDDLNETNLASLPHRVKTYVANERAKQAATYTKEVIKNLKQDGYILKPTAVSPKYKQHFKWLFQVYFDKQQFSEIAAAENTDIANVSREVKKIVNLLGFGQPSHIKQGRKKGSRNNPITSKLGKNQT